MTIKKIFKYGLVFFGLWGVSVSVHALPTECSELTEPATFVSETGVVCLQQTQVMDHNGTFLFKASLQWQGADRPNHFQLLSTEADNVGANVNSPAFSSENGVLTIPKVDITGAIGTERYAVNMVLSEENGDFFFELTSLAVYVNPDYQPNVTWLPYGMLNADERLAVDLLDRALPYAKLADAVYDFDSVVDSWDLLETKDRSSGMQVGLYNNRDNDDLVLAFRGTESCDFPCSLSETKEYLLDVAADALLTFGQDGPQFDDAVEYAQDVVSRFPERKIYVTGHSLGGGLAQGVGALFGLETFAFNSAPVPDDFFDSHDVLLSDAALQEIIHVIGDIRDPVSNTDETGTFYLNADHISPLVQFDFKLKEVLPQRLGELDKLRFNRHSITTFVDNATSLLMVYGEGW